MFILVLSMCCFGLVACSKNEKSDNKKETKQQSIEEKKPLGNLVMKDEEGNVVITVDDIQSAATSVNDDDGMKVYCVAIKFTNEGKEKFAKVTEENVGKLLAIYVDDKVVSTPRIQCAITGGEAIISDAFQTYEECQELVEKIYKKSDIDEAESAKTPDLRLAE